MTFDRTIPAALLDAAERDEPTRGYTFLDEDGKTESFASFADLAATVGRYAAALRHLGLRRGDRVVVAVPQCDTFVFTFLGAMHAGFIPVPMYPPMQPGRLGSYLENSRHIVRTSEATALITDQRSAKLLGSLIGSRLRVVAAAEELETDRAEAPLASLRAEDTAFIQFTSGSISRPKGVVLTHRNLSANAHCIMRLEVNVTPEDSGCTWLPLYHDMGLIGHVLAPIVTATPMAFMPTLLFLKRPMEWLLLISRLGCTLSTGPNFGYALCTSHIRGSLEKLDLSKWRVALCGAEPIQLKTLDAFARRFAAVGFRREAFRPCYGLAESTLAVTFAAADGPRADTVQREALATKGEAIPASPKEAGTVEVVNCGQAFEGHELAIWEEGGRPVGERQVGEIVLRGPSVMAGYFNDRAATSAVLSGGWLRTGDLGYLVGGELHVCGRLKDLIIVAGKNYYPTDIEWAVSEVKGLRRGNVVAFGLADRDGGPDRVIVCAETTLKPERHAALSTAVAARVLEVLGLKIEEVVLLKPRTLPKTSSGKLQRLKTKNLYESGELRGAGRLEGRMDRAKRLAASQWGFLRNRLARAVSWPSHG